MAWYSTYGPLVFGLVLIWLWFYKGTKEEITKNRKAVLYAVVAAGIALAVNQLIIAFYFRPRPFIDHIVTLLIDRSSDPSFPSDHATGAFSLALTILLMNRKFGFGMLAMAVLLAFSRVFVGAHYPMDVIGGALTGLIGTLIIKWQGYRLEPLFQRLLGIWDKIEVGTLLRGM